MIKTEMDALETETHALDNGAATGERVTTKRLANGSLVPVATGTAARRNQRGMVSAEWAVAILAAIALAGVLIAVVTTGSVQQMLLKFILFVIEGFARMAK